MSLEELGVEQSQRTHAPVIRLYKHEFENATTHSCACILKGYSETHFTISSYEQNRESFLRAQIYRKMQ